MKEITVPAVLDALATVTAFVESELEANESPPAATMALLLAVEELFVNIAHYAYRSAAEGAADPPDPAPGGGAGDATIRCAVENAEGSPRVTVQFLDRGRPYNPLESAEPELDLSAEERPIGGLGIFLVKKTMDAIDYEYRDGLNILTIRKALGGSGKTH